MYLVLFVFVNLDISLVTNLVDYYLQSSRDRNTAYLEQVPMTPSLFPETRRDIPSITTYGNGKNIRVHVNVIKNDDSNSVE